MLTVGIDEVGRGCWAGPLVAGAVLLAKPIPGLRDSKKLSKLQRERLTVLINAQALGIGLGWVSSGEIDTIGLTAAVGLAMRRALAQITVEYDEVIIDGSFNFLADNPLTSTLIKADDLVPAVSAASIVAKVARDNYMAELALLLPNYGFEQHVGYGTAAHIMALKTFGVTDHHRKSYNPVAALLQ
jgi:ribonuclease HII